MGFVGTLVNGALAVGALYATGRICYEIGRDVERINAAYERAEEESRHKSVKKEEPEEDTEQESEPEREEKPRPAKRGIRGAVGRLFGLDKVSMVRDILNDPEAHKVEAYLDGDEAVFRIKRRPRNMQTA